VARLGCCQRDCAQRGYSNDQTGPLHHARYFHSRHCRPSIPESTGRQQSIPQKQRCHAPHAWGDSSNTEVSATLLKGRRRTIKVQFTNLENVLWAGGLLSNCALLAVLLLKKVAAEFPVFAAYIAFQVVETFALFGVANRGSNHAYFITYWAFGAVDYAVQIAIIFELARDVLRPTGSWIQDARRSFLSWSAVGTLAAMAMAFAIHPPGRTGLELWSIRSSIFTSFLTCELFLAMSMAANRLGLPWRSPVMALGQVACPIFCAIGRVSVAQLFLSASSRRRGCGEVGSA